MHKKAVIFDFDGVLADTTPLHVQAWKRTFAEVDYDFTYEDYISKASGWGREEAIKNVLPSSDEATITFLSQRKHEHFAAVFSENSLDPAKGALTLLAKLQQQNIPLAVASSSRFASILVKELGLSEFFTVVVTAQDVTKQKPDPELFLLAAKRLSIEPSSCLVIEDAISGIQAAKNAKMHVIGVLGTDKNIAAAADITVNTLEEHDKILAYLENLPSPHLQPEK